MRSRDEEAFAILAEQGTGKSKIIIDTAAWLYAKSEIDTLIVAAPNGVHRNWLLNEIPAHLPDYIERRCAYWVSSPKKVERLEMEHALEPSDGKFLRIITINIEAISTPRGREFIRMLHNSTRALFVIDESSRIKTPGAKRTKFIVSQGPYFKYRRILTGTAVTQGPFDLFSQFKFLDPSFLGFNTFTSFRSYFGQFERKRSKHRDKNGNPIYYDDLVKYLNLPELTKLIQPHSFRIRKADCLDLPDKIYEKRYVELSRNQRRIYDDLIKNNIADIYKEGIVPGTLETDQDLWEYLFGEQKVKSKNAMTKLLRLQQVLGGFATDTDGKVHAIDDKNARIAVLLETLEEIDGKVIIWARFRAELAAISETLREKYGEGSVVEYHGGVSNDERAANVALFQNNPPPGREAFGARFFVGNQHSGGIGLTLTAANFMIYFSQDYSLEARLQSEDRAHRIGQKSNVTYIDLVALGTVDENITKSLIEKNNIAQQIIDPDLVVDESTIEHKNIIQNDDLSLYYE